jgi:phosphoglycolate phosphatase
MAQAAGLKIFCDLDGTLLDVAPRHYKVYSEIVQEMGGSPLDQPTYWDLKRKKTTWDVLLPMCQLSVDDKQTFLDKFIKKIENPSYLAVDKLFDGALETLKFLSSKGDCYLVSLRRNEANLKEEVRRLGLEPHVHEVLSGHSESDGYDVKIQLIQTKLGDNRGIIIGDTEADIITGKKLGLTTVAVLSGIRDKQFLVALEPDYLLQNISESKDLPLF